MAETRWFAVGVNSLQGLDAHLPWRCNKWPEPYMGEDLAASGLHSETSWLIIARAFRYWEGPRSSLIRVDTKVWGIASMLA
jgi:hypothetical protein